MKSIKDVSLILDVSTTTVYNHIKKLGKEIKPYLFNVKGTTYLNDEGIRQIKISMGLLEVPTVQENISMEDITDAISLKVTNSIKEDYKSLQGEIKEVREENKAILEQNKLLIEMMQDKETRSILDKLKDLFK